MAKQGHEKKHGHDTMTSDRDGSAQTPHSEAAAPPRETGADAASPIKPIKKKDLLRRPAPRRADKEGVALQGLVVDVFGRRFTLESDGARTLVDLGRRGAALATVSPGARVTVAGRRKNGELKAWTLRDEADGRTHALRKSKRVAKRGAQLSAPAPEPTHADPL